MSVYLGLDNGLSGGIAVIKNRKIIELCPMPLVKLKAGKNEYDYHAILKILQKYPDSTVILEKAHPTPMLGTQSAFRFGMFYGVMIGMLTATKHRYHIVHAKTWQTMMFRDQPHEDTKSASKIVAKRLFPEQSFLVGKSKKIHDGLTDAVLMAEFGRRNNL